MADGSTVAVRTDVQARLRDAAGRQWRAARVGSAASSRRWTVPCRVCSVLGTQRGGTTSLYRWLAGHPQVQSPLDKEIQFFSVEWSRGIDWYRCHFGPTGDGRLNFEASPYYLYHPCAPARAASVLPKAKLVALLRDPVSRAWSHYHHNLRLGLESLTFADAIAAEPERLAGEAERLQADPTAVSFAHRHHSYSTGAVTDRRWPGGERWPATASWCCAASSSSTSLIARSSAAGVPRARPLATARLRARLAPRRRRHLRCPSGSGPS